MTSPVPMPQEPLYQPPFDRRLVQDEFVAKSLMVFFKQLHRMQAAGLDPNSLEGKIQQVEAKLENGEISLDQALSEIASIVCQTQCGFFSEEPPIIKPLSLFLGFLVINDLSEQSGQMKGIILQVGSGQITEEDAKKLTNDLIGEVNKNLSDHFPFFPN